MTENTPVITNANPATDSKVYLLDKTNTRKIGKTNFIVSSFFRTDSSMTYLTILKKLIETELSKSA